MFMKKWLFLLLIIFSSHFLNADPLKDEILRWKTFINNHSSGSEDWQQLRGIAEPIIAKAEKNLNEGRRYYAFHQLAAVNSYLAAEVYMSGQPEESLKNLANLEAEWKQFGATYQEILESKEKPQLDGIRAAYRAAGETAFSEIKPLYEASLEYGRNTEAGAGFFYLGSAQAQREFVRYCAGFRDATVPKPLQFPGLAGELDALEDWMLDNYKPPASIDQHPVFIRTSALLKEAREMYDAGLYYGALYKVIDARIRFWKIINPGKSITLQEANGQADQWLKKLARNPEDHSIARIYIEMAVAEASDTSADSNGGETARAVFEDALPHYFDAFKASRKQSPQITPQVTVTLVRWPYT